MQDQSTPPRHIPLTQGLVTLVDAEDYEALAAYTWYASHMYAVRRIDGKQVRMHRILLNAPGGMDVDHINGDKLDNRRENLRLATRAQNTQNQGRRSTNKSGYKGVCRATNRKSWMATITVNRRQKLLGCFSTPEEAHAAYCTAAKELHGEFARVS